MLLVHKHQTKEKSDMLHIEPTGQACGAVVTGVDLTTPLTTDEVKAIRKGWMENHVLVFPKQKLTNDDFVRFVEYIGPIGIDPYIDPIADHPKIAAIHRRAGETGKLFADSWHSDWSFQEVPPCGTCLFGIDIPASGGDTLFSNQHKAFDEMPDDLRNRLKEKTALHSAQWAYGDNGFYAEEENKGAMNIKTSKTARERYARPLVKPHPETGRLGFFAGSYVVDLEDTPKEEVKSLLSELYRWQSREEFQYRHKWEKDMLIIWDNRSVLHQATGGFEGHERRLHRLTIGDDPTYYAK
jgi:alpha-ketoglutarate-dependent taurine dioxygenase